MSANLQKTLLDLLFTLLIPLMVLSPNLLGLGVSVAEHLGTGQAGHVRAYLLAALIPVAYVLWDITVNRNVSPIALFGGAGALVSGALAATGCGGDQPIKPYAALDARDLRSVHGHTLRRSC